MEHYVVRVSAVGQKLQICPISDSTPQADACRLLDTDVTERLRVPVNPPFLSDSVLCYLIDGRSGEKSLPANICGTCLYHTGCTIYGDLLFVLCSKQAQNEEFCGMTKQQAEQLSIWLREQLRFLD